MRIDNHNHIGVEILAHLQGSYPYAQALEDLKSKAAATGVTHWVVFPFVSYLFPPHVEHLCPRPEADAPIFDQAALKAPYAYANRLLLQETEEFFPESPRRFLPFVMLDPEREPQAQVAALRTLREQHRFFGFKIQSTIIQSKIRSLLDKGSVLVDLAAEWDLPFLIHSSINPADTWAQAADVLAVAEARPDVRFLLAHSCRFDRPSLDRVAALENTWFDCSAHRIHCDLALKDSPAVATPKNRFPANYSDPAEVLYRLWESYPDKLIWGSDSPYYSWVAKSGALPTRCLSSYDEEWNCVSALPEPAQEQICKTNTLNWLKLDENDLLS